MLIIDYVLFGPQSFLQRYNEPLNDRDTITFVHNAVSSVDPRLIQSCATPKRAQPNARVQRLADG